jgi:HEAT repeat protein
MDDVHDDVRATVIRALGSNSDNYRTQQIREKVVDIALIGLKDASISIRISAADALTKFGDPRSEEALLSAMSSSVDDGGEGSQLIISALLALCEIDSKKAVLMIAEKAKSSNFAVKNTALEVLGIIGDPEAESCLIEALEDSNASIRMQAAESLGRLSGSA